MLKGIWATLCFSFLVLSSVLAASDLTSLIVLSDEGTRTDNSTYPVFENETVIIACLTNRTDPSLTFSRQHDNLRLDIESTVISPNESSRIYQERGDGWLNTTIVDSWPTDSGVYTCGGNSRHIFVLNVTYDDEWETSTITYGEATETTPSYLNHAASILVQGAIFYRPKLARVMPYKYPKFLGYIAHLGSNITITCNKDFGSLPGPATIEFRPAWYNDRRRETPLRQHADGDKRVTFIESGPWQNVTITNVTYSDSGRYKCDSDFKNIRVLNPGNTPEVTDYSCVSSNFHQFNCTFYTNMIEGDLMLWHASYTTSTVQKCRLQKPCVNITCETLSTEYSENTGLATIHCGIKYMYYGETYNLKLSGMSPLLNKTFSLMTTLDSTIIKLNKPQVKASASSPRSASFAVTRPGVNSAIKDEMTDLPIRYRVVDTATNTVKIFSSGNDTVEFELSDLSPYYYYNFRVSCQMNNTVNSDVWSQHSTVALETPEARPSIAPGLDDSLFTFNLASQSTCSEGERSVTIFWNVVSSAHDQGNGVITSYSIYNLTNYEESQGDHGAILASQQVLKQVDGSQTKHTLCIGANFTQLGIIAANSAGLGEKFAVYKIPSAESVVPLRSCEIFASFQPGNSVVLEWRGEGHTEAYNYSLYTSSRDGEPNYQSKSISGHQLNDLGEHGIRFEPAYYSRTSIVGLSIKGKDGEGSDIQWVDCVSNSTSQEFSKWTQSVTIEGLNAEVTIYNPCEPRERRPDHYLMFYCEQEKDDSMCTGKLHTVLMTPCNMTAHLTLEKYSTYYAFWSGAYTNEGESGVIISPIFAQTDSRGLLPYELGLIITACVLLIIVPLSFISVWCYKHSWNAKKMAHPKLVQPQTALEFELQDEESEEEYQPDDDLEECGSPILHPYNIPYHSTHNSSTPLLVFPAISEFEMPETKRLLQFSNLNSGAKPVRLNMLNTTYTPNALLDTQSVESLNFSQLPDEYFEQFHSGCEPPPPDQPEDSLSVQMFLAPDSDEDDDRVVIQLGDFLQKPHQHAGGESGDNPSNYANIKTNTYISHADIANKTNKIVGSNNTDTPSYYGDYLIHTSIDHDSGPSSDYYSGSGSGSGSSAASQPNSADYIVHTSIVAPHLDIISSGSSTHDSIEELSGPPSPTLKGYEESSSGDSGYISPADVIRARELAHAASMMEVET